MYEQKLKEFEVIYQNLLKVHTNGEDSFLMTDCLRAFGQVMTEFSQMVQEEKDAPVETTEE